MRYSRVSIWSRLSWFKGGVIEYMQRNDALLTKPSHVNQESGVNNNVEKNKEVESTRQDEEYSKAFNHKTSSHPIPPTPFPSRLEKIGDEKQSKKYLDVLKELHINISFVDALEQMPSYVKFLKDILTKKRRMNHYEIVALSQATRDVFNNGALDKMTDPRSFIIPCSIGGMDLDPAWPEGKIEVVLVKMDKFLFLINFIILDNEADWDFSIIWERPFLSTSRALINIHQGELTMQLNDQEVTFNIVNAIKFPSDAENCSAIESLGWDYCKEEVFVELFIPEEFFKDEDSKDILEAPYLSSSSSK
ncbi:hypothetical protein E6C27_scaffold243G005880 [Cucumis melo var. makuwa]|uniref:Uncharacterized protein n=1 Tax=Cucumis melo var. makuwa TaxID=1194695 RepID=A0A5A7TXP8_CUCMM|nr:hypothetical protein E6C27_scaffold243G005880 [Cucumis melo var. makuwa]